MTDLDDPSLRILRELENEEKTAPKLAKKTNLSRGQVHYRLKNKLSDHVTQTDSVGNPGSAAPTTVWTISESGREILAQTDDTPSTFDEIADIADKSAQEAESAKESVRKYRKKVNRLKDRQDALKSTLPADSWTEVKRTKVASAESAESLSTRINGVERRLRDDVEEVESDLDELAERTARDLDDLEAELGQLTDQLHRVATAVEDQEERIDALETRLAAVENRSLRDFLPF